MNLFEFLSFVKLTTLVELLRLNLSFEEFMILGFLYFCISEFWSKKSIVSFLFVVSIMMSVFLFIFRTSKL